MNNNDNLIEKTNRFCKIYRNYLDNDGEFNVFFLFLLNFRSKIQMKR